MTRSDRRRLRLQVALLASLVVLFGVGLVVGVLDDSRYDLDRVVVAVTRLDRKRGPKAFVIEAEDDRFYAVLGDPGVGPGTPLVVHIDDDARFVGARVENRELPAATGLSGDPTPRAFVVFFAVVCGLAILAGALLCVAGMRTARVVSRDLAGGSTTVSGRYAGSWRCRRRPVAGLVVELVDGDRRHHLATGTDDVRSIRRFEEAIKGGDRRVSATIAPRSKVVYELRCGDEVLDLRTPASGLDDPSFGLPL